jgi:hypothetical protein
MQCRRIAFGPLATADRAVSSELTANHSEVLREQPVPAEGPPAAPNIHVNGKKEIARRHLIIPLCRIDSLLRLGLYMNELTPTNLRPPT